MTEIPKPLLPRHRWGRKYVRPESLPWLPRLPVSTLEAVEWRPLPRKSRPWRRQKRWFSVRPSEFSDKWHRAWTAGLGVLPNTVMLPCWSRVGECFQTLSCCRAGRGSDRSAHGVVVARRDRRVLWVQETETGESLSVSFWSSSSSLESVSSTV